MNIFKLCLVTDYNIFLHLILEMDTDESENERKKKLLELTDLVDQMTGAGYYDIYTDTYEKIKFKIDTVSLMNLSLFVEHNLNIILIYFLLLAV